MSKNNTIVLLNCNTLVLEKHNSLVLNIKMNFSERIKAARLHAKLSQEELALAIGVSQGLISKIERGDQDETASIVKIAKVCGVSPFWLDTEEGEMVEEYPTYDKFDKQVLAIMQHMDMPTKYQLVKISNSLAEPTENNGTEK